MTSVLPESRELNAARRQKVSAPWEIRIPIWFALPSAFYVYAISYKRTFEKGDRQNPAASFASPRRIITYDKWVFDDMGCGKWGAKNLVQQDLRAIAAVKAAGN